jgi:magnesium transporter
MRRLYHVSRKPVGQAPGTVEHVGEQKVDKVRITLTDYDPPHVEEREIAKVEECFPYRDAPTVSWINIIGLHDTQLLEKLGEHFGLHPLVLEDIANTHQRPKIEDYQGFLYLVCRMITFNEEIQQVKTEQISIVLGQGYIFSFQEQEGDVFDPVRRRIRHGKGKLRKAGPDYLLYTLLDAVVDNYFLALEKIGEQIEELEEKMLEHPTSDLLQTIHTLKREMILIRRSIWPLREVLGDMQRAESALIEAENSIFLRDVYDHTIQVADIIDSFRDLLSGLQDLYLSSLSNRMNEVMKVLTIIATIFVPLTFVAGLYGMNFDFMPELRWKWGYLAVWIVMIGIAGIMLSFFHRKRWL